MTWRVVFVLLACVAIAGCAAAGYRPGPGANSEPIHGESGGGGGAGM